MWLLDIAVILLAFELCNVWVKAPSEDLNFPYVTAREDNVLVQLHYLLNSLMENIKWLCREQRKKC